MTRRFAVLPIALLVLLSATVTPSHPDVATADSRKSLRIWDARDTEQAGQLTIYNADNEGTLLGEPVGSGDLDGDGYDDVVLAPFYAPSGPNNDRLGAGKLHVYFGGPDVLDGSVLDAAAPPSDSVQVWGARSGDFLGTEVDVVDVTGDGLDDILACAENADGFDAGTSRNQAGALYVIPGRTVWPSPMNLSSPGLLDLIQILGARQGDRLGFWAAGGDVTGDGVDDILVSADLSPGPGGAGTHRGALYIIPGGPSLPPRIDLGDAAQLRGLEVTAVYGVDDGDHFGSCIAAADFDGDGIDDVAVSAGVNRAGAAFSGHGQPSGGLGTGGGDGPNGDRADAGEVYLLYGRADWPATIDLRGSAAGAAIYYGEAAGDFFGEELHAGDVDGDGLPELAVGALLADAPGRANSGIGYLLWGASLRRGERLDLNAARGSARLTRILAEAAGDIGADSLRLADVDGDGLAEVLFGSPTHSPAGRETAGDLKIIFGTRDGLPPLVDLASPPSNLPVFQIVPPDPEDIFTYSLAFGDVDGDGYQDLIPNAMGGDGSRNRFATAGEAYVISGRELSSRAGRGGGSPPCLTRVDASPARARYFAGESGIELTLRCTEEGGAGFEPGAVAVVRGVEVAATHVSASELRVRLDDAPEARNRAGQLVVQARNPGGATSAAVLSITLVGPTIARVRAASKANALQLTINGRDFLPAATVLVTGPDGAEVAVDSVSRRSAKKMRVRIASGLHPSGTLLAVRVVNPGPAPSDAATFAVP